MDHVLVVEDDINNALVFKALLSRLGGFEVTVTEDVEEILRLCRSGSVSLVIMDVSLSQSVRDGEKLNGIDITRLLKNDEQARHIPVMLATAHAMKGDRERFLAASGAEGYVTKPVVNHRELIQQIRELIAAARVAAGEVGHGAD
jgi:CheY-like chemotaxis protein